MIKNGTKERNIFIVILFITILFVFAGIALLSLGAVRQVSGPQIGPSLETNAVVSNTKHIREWDWNDEEWDEEFWIYLDFSSSQVEPELINILTRLRQGVALRYGTDFSKFEKGQEVIVVYHRLGPENKPKSMLVVDYLDSSEASSGSGNLTTLDREQSNNIFFMVIGGIFLAMAVLFSIMCFAYGKRIRRRSPFTRVWTFPLKDGAHTVGLVHGYFKGNREITVDGVTMILPSGYRPRVRALFSGFGSSLPP